MARIVLTVYGSYGDVYPSLAIGRRLKERGHDPVLAAPATYETLARAIDLDFVPVRPDVSASNPELYARVMEPKRGAEVIVREILVPALRDTFQDLEGACEGADLIVSHVLTYAAPILAEKRGLPWAATVLSPMVFASAHDPPALAPLPGFAKLKFLGPGAVGLLWRLMNKVAWKWSAPVRAFREELGLPAGGDPLWGCLEDADRVLALFSGELTPPRPDWPEATIQCGFPFHDHDFGGGQELETLEQFLDGGEPPVVFTLGSSAVQVAGDFYEVAARAVSNLGLRGVLVCGPAAAPQRVSDDVLVVESAPVHRLFPAASVVVHAGGVGTIGQALRSGRPQLVVPFAHDHFDNGRLAENRGVARVLPRRKLSAPRLTRMLEGILEDPSIRKRASDVAERVRREDGAGAACAALEGLLTTQLAPGRG